MYPISNIFGSHVFRDYFRNKRAIHFIKESGEALWVYPDECVWQAPIDMISKKPLMALCRNRYFDSTISTSETSLTQFFHTTLKIPDTKATDLVIELLEIKISTKPEYLANVPNIYRQIYEMSRNNSEEVKEIR